MPFTYQRFSWIDPPFSSGKASQQRICSLHQSSELQYSQRVPLVPGRCWLLYSGYWPGLVTYDDCASVGGVLSRIRRPRIPSLAAVSFLPRGVLFCPRWLNVWRKHMHLHRLLNREWRCTKVQRVEQLPTINVPHPILGHTWASCTSAIYR